MTTLPQPASALQAVFRVTQLPAWCRFGWPPIAAALVLAVLVLATAAACTSRTIRSRSTR